MVKGDSMAGLQTYTTFMISKACAKYFHLIIYKRWGRNERIPQKNCKFAPGTIIIIIMTEIQKQYRLTSTEEPTDERSVDWTDSGASSVTCATSEEPPVSTSLTISARRRS